MKAKEINDLFIETQNYWKSIYQKSYDDLQFLSDDNFAQWDSVDAARRNRAGRPVITIDCISQFVHQVANDIRMNTPAINVFPSDANASLETAEIFKGLIKDIEYKSNADDAYDTASLNAIRCGIGFIRVRNKFINENEQGLFIERVVNPLAVYIDGESVEIDGRDAKHAFVVDSISLEEFKKRYGRAQPVSFGEEDAKIRKGEKPDRVVIAEAFIKDGDTIKHLICSGADILEETVFPSKYVPIVPVFGEEIWIGGERHIYSLIRKSKQAQKLYNYWKSIETELLMSAPKAHVIAAVGQVEDFEEEWVNPDMAAVLRYKQTDAEGRQAPPPQRLAPAPVPSGVINASRMAIEDIKATMGIYNASLGQRSNEVSGIAILRRQQEGDVATFHFLDNLVKSIAHVGRILVDAIPIIYDTPRIVTVLNDEHEPKLIGINGATVPNQPITIDLKQGKYDVRVTTGSSYTTRRQETAHFLTQIVSTNPDLIKVIGDVLFENMDFAGAQQLAKRMKKIIDPTILNEDGENPELSQLIAALQQAQAKIAELEKQLADKQAQIAAEMKQTEIKTQAYMAEIAAKNEKARMEMLLAQKELELKQMEMRLKEMELQIKNKEVDIKAQNALAQMKTAETIYIDELTDDNRKEKQK